VIRSAFSRLSVVITGRFSPHTLAYYLGLQAKAIPHAPTGVVQTATGGTVAVDELWADGGVQEIARAISKATLIKFEPILIPTKFNTNQSYRY
jgi:hypothetical protein